MAIDRSVTHAMLARPTADEADRLQYIVGLKRRLTGYASQMRVAYDKRAAPAFELAHGRPPDSVSDIAEAMSLEPLYPTWSRLSRSAQDIMWSTVHETVRREAPRQRAAAAAVSNRPAGGSLTLTPDFEAPADAFVAHIHGQPKGYMADEDEGDLEAGALYESGGNAFSSGTGIGSRDSKAGALIAYLEKRRPGFSPKRILDLGCSAGGASVSYAEHFPQAEVHGVDLGPGLLRYAHARAEHLGLPVHFHQMDAGKLAFYDGSFDLVVSHNLMHEVSSPMLEAIFREAQRVVAHGGIVVHQDVPARGRNFSALDRFMFSWQTRNNNEPFWDTFIDNDIPAVMRAAGFAGEQTEELTIPMIDGPRFWYLVLGEKPRAAPAAA